MVEISWSDFISGQFLKVLSKQLTLTYSAFVIVLSTASLELVDFRFILHYVNFFSEFCLKKKEFDLSIYIYCFLQKLNKQKYSSKEEAMVLSDAF